MVALLLGLLLFRPRYALWLTDACASVVSVTVEEWNWRAWTSLLGSSLDTAGKAFEAAETLRTLVDRTTRRGEAAHTRRASM